VSRARRLPRTALRSLVVAIVAAAVVSAGAAIVIWAPWQEAAETSDEPPTASVVTVPADWGTLTSRLRLNAALEYGNPISLPVSPGIVTALPLAGQTIEAGQPVYESNGRPVILLEGARPLWRDLSSDAEDGQDVFQLEQNLARFGYFDGEPDTRFDWWTTDAVRRWQRELGLPVTGTLAAADVVVADAPSIRISQVTSELGVSGTSPATYTATTLMAVAKLTDAQARGLATGTPVTVVLPDGTEVENRIAALDPGGQPTGEEGQTTPPTATIEFADQEQVSSTGPASIRIVVENNPDSGETLIVPTTALIATAEYAYAVEVLDGERIVRIPVRIGIVADARVQVLASGPDVEGAPSDARALAAGDEVVISR
jgi:peptidoglycan hydrolase-like protein with peptidoglycan-binding domain